MYLTTNNLDPNVKNTFVRALTQLTCVTTGRFLDETRLSSLSTGCDGKTTYVTARSCLALFRELGMRGLRWTLGF